MKIAHILWSGGVGGIERVVYDLAEAQRSLGEDLVLFFGQGEGLFFDKAVSSRIAVQDFHLKSGYDLPLVALGRTVRLMRGLDVLHFHGFSLFFAAAAILAGTPVVYTDHGHDLTLRSRSLSRPLRDGLRAWFVRNYPAVVTANSHFTSQLGAQEFGLPVHKIQVVYNGVDPEQLQPQQSNNQVKQALGFTESDFIVGTVCRLVAFKRVDRLIIGFSRMRQIKNARLMVVGDGPLLGDLQSQAAKLGIAEQVLFTGSRSNVPDLLQVMDVFVQSSQAEPFGIAALEALCLGRPVIAFADAGGLVEILQGVGRVVADENELGATLDIYIENRVAVIPPAIAADFQISRMADRFRQIYSSISKVTR